MPSVKDWHHTLTKTSPSMSLSSVATMIQNMAQNHFSTSSLLSVSEGFISVVSGIRTW